MPQRPPRRPNPEAGVSAAGALEKLPGSSASSAIRCGAPGSPTPPAPQPASAASCVHGAPGGCFLGGCAGDPKHPLLPSGDPAGRERSERGVVPLPGWGRGAAEGGGDGCPGQSTRVPERRYQPLAPRERRKRLSWACVSQQTPLPSLTRATQNETEELFRRGVAAQTRSGLRPPHSQQPQAPGRRP